MTLHAKKAPQVQLNLESTNDTQGKKDLAVKPQTDQVTAPWKQIEGYQATLNKPVPPEEIKLNKAAKNSAYLPISFIQMKLDEQFFGLWTTRNYTTKVVANEIVGELELVYFHPVAQVWITRIGCAATMIQMKSTESGGDGDITNIRNKITNTLVKDYPHLYAECLKSAAKTIGVMFGRDLNREHTDNYQPQIPEMEKKAYRSDEMDLLLEQKQVPLNFRNEIKASREQWDAARILKAVEYLRTLPEKTEGDL